MRARTSTSGPSCRWTPITSTRARCSRSALRGKFLDVAFVAMKDELLLRFERCGLCFGLFALCRGCYRGQSYCSDACQAPARTAQLRAARARHQQSPEGRADHADRNRELRRRKREASRVMDHGSEKLASERSVCLPQGSTPPTDGGEDLR